MKIFIFASLRGSNFRIQADTVEEAYQKLVEQEKDNGTLWRLSDPYMVEHCCNSGWLRYGENPGVAYKMEEIKR